MDRTVAVTGATGRQGGAVARLLRSRGWTVRALTRRPASPAARELAGQAIHTVACDLADRASIGAALAGASRLYLTTTPYEAGIDAEVEQALATIAAARAAGIGQIVYASVAGADRPTGVAHFESKGRIERALAESGIGRFTILRPAFFMEMLLGDAFRGAIAAGRVALTLPADTPISLVATADIATFAALAFERPDALHAAAIELAGDQPTIAGMVAILAEGLGRAIRYERVSAAAFDPAMRPSLGTQHWLATAGWRIDIAALAARWGVPLTGLAEWTAAHRGTLLEQEALHG